MWQVGLGSNGLDLTWFGRDFRIYRDAALALIAGGDPYGAFDVWNGRPWHFAAPPPAAQLFVPFALLPEGIGLAIFLGLSLVCCGFALRRLGLPLWWLLFPPLVEGLAAANPQVLVLGLLIVGGALGGALAGGFKTYAVLPIVARRQWHALATFAGLLAASVLLAPAAWQAYVAQFGAISSRLVGEAEGGLSVARLFQAGAFNVLGSLDTSSQAIAAVALVGAVGALLGLVLWVDVPAAGWLGVALLWPAAEYHLATFALPVARRLGIWVLAIPFGPTYLLGLVLLAYGVVAGQPALTRERGERLRAWLAGLAPRRAPGGLARGQEGRSASGRSP